MRGHSLVLLLIPVCALAQEPNQTFRTTVNIVVAPTTVTDRDGNFVPGLKPSDFRLYDSGTLQDIRVDVAFQPISLVVAVQADAAVEGVLPQIMKIGPMLQPLIVGDQGEAAILCFDHRIQDLQDFTNDSQKLIDALKKLRPGSSSSRLNDAMIEGVHMLRRRPPDRRRVLLLVSESRDKGSEGRVREALTEAQFADVTIYSIIVPRLITALTQSTPVPRPDPIPTEARHAPAGVVLTPQSADQRNYGNMMPAFEEIFRGVKAIFVPNPLEVFTKFTAGREYSFHDQRSLERAVSDIGEELHSQYLISYNPNNKMEGGYHEIKVQIPEHPDLRIRTRDGYWMASVPEPANGSTAKP